MYLKDLFTCNIFFSFSMSCNEMTVHSKIFLSRTRTMKFSSVRKITNGEHLIAITIIDYFADK